MQRLPAGTTGCATLEGAGSTVIRSPNPARRSGCDSAFCGAYPDPCFNPRTL
jgi:hypothetical protein